MEPPSTTLSDLPAELKIHILSFLPFKSAIATSVLSSEWRDLWLDRHQPSPSKISLPQDDVIINLSSPNLRHDIIHLSSASRHYRNYAAATSVSVLYVSDIELFHLRFRTQSGSPPRDVTSLQRLSLNNLCVQIPRRSNRFPNLETLTLDSVEIVPTDLSRLLSSCPSLRSIHLSLCRDLPYIHIDHPLPSLADVFIIDCVGVVDVKVRTMNLKKFWYKGRSLKVFSLSSLDDVCIQFNIETVVFPDLKWMSALWELRRVRVITMCSSTLKCIITASAALLRRNYHISCDCEELHLVMHRMTKAELMNIFDLFRLCDCFMLAKLIFQLPNTHMMNFLDVYEDPLPEFRFTSLKEVKLNNFTGDHSEMQLLRLILSSAVLLEVLVIIVPEDRLQNVLEQLSEMRRNYHAKIIVTEHDDGRVRPTHLFS